MGTFIHMVWSCSLLQIYWRAVVADVNRVAGLHLDMYPLVFLLAITDSLATTKHIKLFVFYAAYYSRKVILSKWKLPDPPMPSAWKALMNPVLPLYKITYLGHNCPQKFNKIWSSWAEARHITI